MIEDDAQLQQVLDQIARMYRALAALRHEVLPLNSRQFALLAEGPIDEIEKLEAEVREYVRWPEDPKE
jgi:hypothetical protein